MSVISTKNLPRLTSDSRVLYAGKEFRNGFELPADPHFWPIYKEGVEEEQNPSKRTRLVDEEHDDFIFKYPNGKFAPAEIQLNELPENDLIDRYVTL